MSISSLFPPLAPVYTWCTSCAFMCTYMQHIVKPKITKGLRLPLLASRRGFHIQPYFSGQRNRAFVMAKTTVDEIRGRYSSTCTVVCTVREEPQFRKLQKKLQEITSTFLHPPFLKETQLIHLEGRKLLKGQGKVSPDLSYWNVEMPPESQGEGLLFPALDLPQER